MLHTTLVKPIFLLFIPFLFIQCKQEASPTALTTEDTRILVNQAYDSLDPTGVRVVFNAKRAAIIKARLDLETNLETRINLTIDYAIELLRAGQTLEALSIFDVLTRYIIDNKIELDPALKRHLYNFIGITFLRHGEIENCVRYHNHESCIVPILNEGVHKKTYGAENAVIQFEASLAEFPGDEETIYLLNLAYMALGQYPDKVPAKYRINPSWFSSKHKIKPFEDVAAKLGLNRRGHAGGSVIDDFNNDGWLDIVITSWGPTDSLILYINNGNGTFTDKTTAYGLSGHVGSLHLTKADFNNDGWLDLLLLRGAWYQNEGDMPKTLLMNTGKGGFTDVTIKAGLTKYAASQASAWADVNLDGWIDLIVANESLPDYARGIDMYINQKDGTFSHESNTYGLTVNRFYKGVVATDVNLDRYPDFYMSTIGNGNELWMNEDAGNGKRKLVLSTSSDLQLPMSGFGCWSFDFNNDGNEDLFTSSFDNALPPGLQWMQSKKGTIDKALYPKLYANRGNMKFDEVGLSMGLNEVAFTMGCNFGDINADGFLDFYLATGNPNYQALVPNKVYLNMEGSRFEDVTYSGGFGNIQKGHGVSFGDLDHDGDEDIYVVIGGGYDGDFFYNSLMENPNEHNNHWLILDLEGTTANKRAIGARVEVTVSENGTERKIFRNVTSGASFGGNSYILELGLREADNVKSVVVQWPCLSCPDQTFTGLEINHAYRLTEGQPAAKTLPYQRVRLGSSGHDQHVQ
jgi:hypothetical protein